jgi:regulator of protease activity HflC (stomatin/prohibitin superfamily)
MAAPSPGMFVLFVIVVVYLIASVNVLNEWERGVVFTLGKFAGVREPGLQFIFPPFQTMQRISLRVVVLDVPPQDIITRDNVSVKVNAVVYYQVLEPSKAVLKVDNYYYATSQLAQTTLRGVLGKMEMDDLLASRDKINQELQHILDAETEPWGVKVAKVEVKNVDLPQEMQRAMAIQAQAERERRAKIIHSEGELQASEKLSQAAEVMSKNPAALQLRYMQTLVEIAADKNSTIVFPFPIDMLQAFMKRFGAN